MLPPISPIITNCRQDEAQFHRGFLQVQQVHASLSIARPSARPCTVFAFTFPHILVSRAFHSLRPRLLQVQVLHSRIPILSLITAGTLCYPSWRLDPLPCHPQKIGREVQPLHKFRRRQPLTPAIFRLGLSSYLLASHSFPSSSLLDDPPASPPSTEPPPALAQPRLGLPNQSTRTSRLRPPRPTHDWTCTIARLAIASLTTSIIAGHPRLLTRESL